MPLGSLKGVHEGGIYGTMKNSKGSCEGGGGGGGRLGIVPFPSYLRVRGIKVAWGMLSES